MAETTSNLQALWKKYECQEDEMALIPFGPDRIRVAPPTAPAWEALAAVLLHHGYDIRTSDTDSYNCRNIKNTQTKSLHSYGIALDVNWNTNPFIDHSGNRKVRFSGRPTQSERAEDVRLGTADTDMTEAMIDDVVAIQTKNGKRVFEWGGHWRSIKDCMHFEIDVAPDDLEAGIDEQTVKGWDAFVLIAESDQGPGAAAAMGVVTDTGAATGPGAVVDRHIVVARSGLRLRADASDHSDVLRTLPNGTVVNVLRRVNDWALVDLEMDGQADGFMSLNFLRQVDDAAAASSASPAGGMPTALRAAGGRDITGLVTVDQVAAMFPQTPKANIMANLPHVLAGLRNRGIPDRSMVLMALATIRAETAGFKPISEFKSRFNTRVTPFDLYDAGTRKGRALGNTERGDGPRFKGRGYVQLTGRFNYKAVGGQLGVNLAGDPELANDPAVAGLILAQFLANKQARIRVALAKDDLADARKAVNGGSHGLDAFVAAYRVGQRVLPN